MGEQTCQVGSVALFLFFFFSKNGPINMEHFERNLTFFAEKF